jgi:ankyrin repeat protein
LGAEDCLKILLIDDFSAGIRDLEAAVQSLNISLIRLIDAQVRPVNSDRALAANRAALLLLVGVFWFLSEKSDRLNRQIWMDGAIAARDEVAAISVGFAAPLAVRDELMAQLELTADGIRSGECELWFRMVHTGDLGVVRKLILAGIDIERKNWYGRTGLMFAAYGGYLEMVKLLVERGAEVGEKDEDGTTSLMFAAFGGNLEMVKVLIERGARLEEKDKNGMTSLMFAAQEGNLEIVKLLVERGARLEEKDNYGIMSLMIAACSGGLEMVKLLVERGAKVEEKDKHDMTSLMFAARSGSLEMVKLLVEGEQKWKRKAKMATRCCIITRVEMK